jgi:hypothetical protein
MILRIAENITLGDILNANIDRDQDDFHNYAPRFDDVYRSTHKTAVDTVRGMERVAVKTGQNKLYTRNLYAKVDALTLPLYKMEGYVKHAGKLNLLDTPVENFGLHQVRTDVHQKDLEGLGDSLEVLNQNIDHNKTVLLNEGMPQEDIDALKTVKTEIDAENTQQELNKEDRNILATGNQQLLDILVELNKDILDVGKRIYRGVNAAKYNDYVLIKILGRIRHEGTHTQNEGALIIKCVTAANQPIAGLSGKVVGKDDTAVSDTDGVMYFDNITFTTGEKILVEITGEGYLTKLVSDIDLLSGNELDLTVTIDPA